MKKLVQAIGPAGVEAPTGRRNLALASVPRSVAAFQAGPQQELISNAGKCGSVVALIIGLLGLGSLRLQIIHRLACVHAVQQHMCHPCGK